MARREKYIKDYENIMALDATDNRYNSKVRTPYTHTQLMTHTAFSVAGILPQYPWFGVELLEPWSHITGLEDAAIKELNFRLKRALFYRKYHRWTRAAGSNGMAWMKMTWHNGLSISLGEPGNLAWDPNAENLRFDAAYVIERNERLTLRELLDLARQEVFDAGAVVKAFGRDPEQADDPPQTMIEERARRREGFEAAIATELDSPVRLYHMVSPSRIISVHRESNTVVRDRDNPYAYTYYYDMVPFPELTELDGYSIPRLLSSVQEEKDTWRRQRTDVRSLEANPMWRFRRGSGLDPYGFVCRPGKLIPVDDPEDFTPVPSHDTGGPLIQEEMIRETEGDRLIGVTPHVRGEGGADMKATVASLLHTNINIRHSVQQKDLASYPIGVFLDDFTRLVTMYEEPLKVTPLEWQIIRSGIEQGAIGLVTRQEAHVGNPLPKVQQLQQMFMGAAQVLAPPGLAELFKRMLELLQVRDPEKITKWFRDPPETGPLEQGQKTELEGEGQGIGLGVPRIEESARSLVPGQGAMPMGVPA